MSSGFFLLLKTQIKKRAQELGFDDCRITSSRTPESAQQFRHWLDEGCHGEMAYLHRNAHKRVNPQEVLLGAKSIISLAVSYSGTPQDTDVSARPGREMETEKREQLPGKPGPLGEVARYARYEDYHDVMGIKLKSLTDYLGTIGGPDSRSLWYVDTGPLLERDLGQRAGLGFIGKHTNLISRRLGNWIFLGEILTTIELEPDASEKNRCGSCTRCMSACPTAAFTAPFQLDARRCISYLTIELKGSIPREYRPLIGNRIYGCDDCLAVCPWNRFAKEGEMMKPHARRDLEEPDLLELLKLDDASFKERFRGSPILRTKRRGFLRNVCVALGNSAGKSALPALQIAASDAEALISEHANWAIEQIENREGAKPKAGS